MKIRSLAVTVAAVTLIVQGLGTAHGVEAGPRDPAKASAAQVVTKGRQRAPTSAATSDPGLLAAAAQAARRDSDPELNGAIRDPRPNATATTTAAARR